MQEIILIVLWIVIMVSGMYFVYTRGYKKGWDTGFPGGVDSGKQLGYTNGYIAAQSKAWTNIIATGEGLSLYINGKEVQPTLGVDPKLSGARTIGIWHLDGHIRDGFMGPAIATEEFALRMYAKDHNKILNKMDLKPGPLGEAQVNDFKRV